MSLNLEQICKAWWIKAKPGANKWLKNQRNRKIRRVKKTETPNIKYKYWDK